MKSYIFLLIFIISIYRNAFSQCNTLSNYLGLDLTLCWGQQVTFNVPTGYNFFTWSNGSPNQSVSITQNTQLISTLSEVSNDLVVNGGFELGDQGFLSEYDYGTGGTYGLLSSEGQYAIATSPSGAHNNFLFCSDHTSGNGNIFIANGSGNPNTKVWCQTFAVDQNTTYQFSTWAMNVLDATDNSDLQFLVNDLQIGSIFSTSVLGCQWEQFYQEWNSGLNNSAEICIVNQSTIVSGNDFALDDISFKKVCMSTDTVQVTFEPSPILTVTNDAICQDEQATISVFGAVSYNWSNPVALISNLGDSLLVNPSQTTNYNVTGMSQNGCTATASAQVVVNPSFIINVQNGVMCQNATDTLIVSGANAYVWSPAISLNTNIGDTVIANPSSTQIYTVVGELNGCFETISVTLNVVPAPQANFEILSTNFGILTPIEFGNTSQNATLFDWDFGNGEYANQVGIGNQQTAYENINSYSVTLFAYNSTCIDSITKIFEIKPDISIEFPNIFTPNLEDTLNSFFSLSPKNFKTFEIKILNRWGNLLFEGDVTNEKWDGRTSDNNDALEGTYYYIFEGIGFNDESKNGHGFFQLIR